MRIQTLLGIALIVVAAVVLYRGGTFTTNRTVLDVGPLSVSAEEQHPIRPWIAGLVLVGGAALAITGARRKA